MTFTEIYYRLRPALMMGIDLVTPVIVMGGIGLLVGKFELALAAGFALGLLSYFRHWARGNTQPKDYSDVFKKKQDAALDCNEESDTCSK